MFQTLSPVRTEWAITRDALADENAKPGTHANAVGLIGPRDAMLKFDEIVNHPEGVKFRMYDDDGELMYEGVRVGPDNFAPLDDFGMPNAGATEIHERSADGKWAQV